MKSKQTIIKKLASLFLTVLMVMGLVSTAAITVSAGSEENSDVHAPEGYANVWYESFESGSLPDGWSVIDKDGDGYNWTTSPGNSTTRNCHGENAIYSNSYIIGSSAVTPDNWLVLPEQTLESDSHYIFSFEAMAQNKSFPNDKFGVYISTDSGVNYTQLGEDYTAGTEWHEISVDLSEYAGKTVTLAVVHHNCYDQQAVVLDCFGLYKEKSTEISEFSVTIDEPVVGQKPSFTVEYPNSDGYAYSASVDWEY